MRKQGYIIPAVWGVFTFIVYFLATDNVSIADMIFRMSFGNGEALFSNSSYLMFCYMNIAFIHVLYGTKIYRHFCEASVYYFARMGDRRKWILHEFAKLALDIVVYLGINLAVIIILNLLSGKLEAATVADIFFIIFYLFCFTMFALTTTLLINLIAVYISSGAGFALVETVCMACIAFYCAVGEATNADCYGYFKKYAFLLWMNPVCHLFSTIDAVNELINIGGLNFDMGVSALYLLVACSVTVLIWLIAIRKMDIMGNNSENQIN